MDQNRLAAVARSVTSLPSRRDVVRSLLAAGLGFGSARLPDAARARKGKKKHRKQAAPNEFGCLNVGAPCQNAGQCCSSICNGKKGKKRCRAHDTGTCAAGVKAYFCGGTDVPCTTSLGNPGFCATTTGNAGYCYNDGNCYACTTDADCKAHYGDSPLGSRAACIRCVDCTATGGTACFIHGAAA